MGSACTVCSNKDDYDDESEDSQRYEEKGALSPNTANHQQMGGGGRSMNAVAMLASMAHQAGGFMNQMAVTNGVMDPMDFHERVRRAKAEMRTVSVRNGSLYIDYEFVARVPPDLDIY